MTNRRRIQRPRKAPISDAAIRAFNEWRKLENQCDCHDRDCSICTRRTKLHNTVGRELQLKPWEYGWPHDPYRVGLLTRAAAGFDQASCRKLRGSGKI
jgi:hypothetical protein